MRSPYATRDTRRLPKISRSSRSRVCSGAGISLIVPHSDTEKAEGIERIALRSSSYNENHQMRLCELNVGCFGGGTGLPSLLGGLKHNPWLRVNAVVTMFDSGG